MFSKCFLPSSVGPRFDASCLKLHAVSPRGHTPNLIHDLQSDCGDLPDRSFPFLGSPPKPSDISSFQPLGGGRFDEYKSGGSPYRISRDLQQKSDDLARLRKPFIVEAMKHAWDGYKRHAFGHDELLPVSRKGADPWGGMGTTLVDSLDTLWIMGLSKEFYEGRDWVRDVSCCHCCVGTVQLGENCTIFL